MLACGRDSVLAVLPRRTVHKLGPGTKYYYQILGGNGTTPSSILSFTTAVKAGKKKEFVNNLRSELPGSLLTFPRSVAVVHDMGYTNVVGTYLQTSAAVEAGAAFV